MLIVRGTIGLVLLALALASCGAGENTMATLVPTVANDTAGSDAISDESPRMDAPPADSGIPPTWTPIPTAEAPPPPAPPATRAPDGTYIVQPGDTLAELAEQFGIGLQQLADANDIRNIDIIRVGEILTIPR